MRLFMIGIGNSLAKVLNKNILPSCYVHVYVIVLFLDYAELRDSYYERCIDKITGWKS